MAKNAFFRVLAKFMPDQPPQQPGYPPGMYPMQMPPVQQAPAAAAPAAAAAPTSKSAA
jgi:hypothetical protein